MNTKFDELTKAMAQSVTRRAALKKFGVALAGMALACFGLGNKAEAGNNCLPAGIQCWTIFDPEHSNPKGVCGRRCCSSLFSCPTAGVCLCK